MTQPKIPQHELDKHNKAMAEYKEKVKCYEYEDFLKKQKEPLDKDILYLLDRVFETASDFTMFMTVLEMEMITRPKKTGQTREEIKKEFYGYVKEIIKYNGPDYPIRIMIDEIDKKDRRSDLHNYVLCIVPLENGEQVLKVGTMKNLIAGKSKSYKIIDEVFRFRSANEHNGSDFVLIPIEDDNGNKAVFFEHGKREILVGELIGYHKEGESFQVKDALMVSDPCYSVGTWCQTKLENVKSGTWKCEAYIRMTDWYIRTWYLRAYHEDLNNDIDIYDEPKEWTEEGYEELESVGVDAGTMTIMDYDSYVEFRKPMDEYKKVDWREREGRDPWHELCDILPDHRNILSYNGIGVISSTGFGDGSYPVFVKKEDGKIVDVIVEFINDSEDDDEYLAEDDQDLGEDSDE